MAGDGIRAVAASMLFIIASMVPVLNSDYLDDSEIFFNSQNFTTEVRIHDIESEWDDSEILIWYPNSPVNERTFQFTVMIDGISDPEEIEYCNLTMTWQYNVSSENHLISVTLDNNNFIEIDGDLFLVYQYQYANNIFFGDYYISLETTDINGNNFSFSHQGIEVLERGFSINIIDNFPENKLIFADGKMTELEFRITNTGVSYSNFDFLLALETDMPPDWPEPQFYNDNVSSIWGGDVISSTISFDAYLDLDSVPPPGNISVHILISYEDDEGNIVELENNSLEFMSIVVPEYSIPAISFSRDENRTELIADSLSQAPLDNSIITTNGETVVMFGNLTNYGFQTSSFEMALVSENSLEFLNFSVFDNGKEIIPNQEGIYSLGTNLLPLESIFFTIEFNLLNSSVDYLDLSIILTEVNTFEDSEVFVTLINYQINNPILLESDSEQNLDLSLGDILQNESFEIQVLFELNPFFLTQGFENQWVLDLFMANDLATLNSQNIVTNLVNTQTEALPFQFSINSKSPYIINFTLNEVIEIGNYSINLTLTQVTDDDESLFFERQINFTIIENASLIIENETENDGSANNNTQDNNSSNNTQNDNLSNNSQNNNPDNSSNLTNNSSEIDTNNNVSENNSSEIPNQQQDNSSVTQNVDTDSSDSAKSEDSNSKSWIFVVLIVIVLTVIMIFIIQRRRPKTSPEQTNKQPISIEPIASIPVIPDISANQLTILHQWTDANGYTWRQMSDRSVLWWNGQNWVPVNQNQ
ncbi:MAG: hypothetical protein CMA81_03645 [Euryarchaeota archaeon]|nr:hypothetical protein [Euryarchaeota archaeon]